MRRLAGQALRVLAWLLHRLGRLVLVLAVLLCAALVILSWRLSAGPVSADWLAAPLQEALNGDGGPIRLSIGHAALAWEGFTRGVDRPLDIRLSRLSVRDADGASIADVPTAEVSLSVGALLRGRILPRAVHLDHPTLRLMRSADGTLSLDTPGAPTPAVSKQPSGSAQSLLWELATPAQNDRGGRSRRSRFGQLRRVQITDADVTIVDRPLDLTWQIPTATIDLRRHTDGGVTGNAAFRLGVNGQHADLRLAAELGADAVTHVTIDVSPIKPADLARAAASLAPLSVLDAPVGIHAELDLGPLPVLRHARLEATLGAGALVVGASSVPLLDGALLAAGDLQSITLQSMFLRAPGGGADTPPTTLAAHATVHRQGARLDAAVALDLDRVSFADLPALWPKGVGGPGTRPWITQNITAGLLRDAHAEITLTGTGDLSDLAVTGATGGVNGEDITVHWLAPIPPVEHVRAHLVIDDPDSITITTHGGRQSPGSLTVPEGRIHLTGLAANQQIAMIDAQLAGPVADALALLRHPRLHLFEHHKLDLADPAGQAAMALSVRLPLENDVSMDSIAIRAKGRLTQLHIADVVAGRALDQGVVALDVTNDGLRVNGTASLAGIPAQLSGQVDFRAGLPADVIQTVSIDGHATAAQLAQGGLAVGDVVGDGAIALHADWASRRDGQSTLAAHADLTDAALDIAPLRWSKAVGKAARADVSLTLKQDHLAAIDRLEVDGEGLSLRGDAVLRQGQPSLLRLDPIEIGRTRARATIAFPESAGGAYVIDLSGTVLDLSARLSHAGPAHAAASPPSAGAPSAPLNLAVDARFDRAIMGNGESFTDVRAHVERSHGAFQRAMLDASSNTRQALHLSITPSGTVRRLDASAGDAGALLRAVDVTTAIAGGRLTVSGTFDDTQPDQPLSGGADIEQFQLVKAQALGKVLQAMTLYGLVDALSGPGLGFTRLVAPFQLTEDALELKDARAFSSSLGLTAKGRIDLRRQVVDLNGTIVPAYFFNSLLGRIPVLGKLFSPEKGGGMFAASYAVRGRLDDPQVSVNPLAALTPGALRGLFGIFDEIGGK